MSMDEALERATYDIRMEIRRAPPVDLDSHEETNAAATQPVTRSACDDIHRPSTATTVILHPRGMLLREALMKAYKLTDDDIDAYCRGELE